MNFFLKKKTNLNKLFLSFVLIESRWYLVSFFQFLEQGKYSSNIIFIERGRGSLQEIPKPNICVCFSRENIENYKPTQVCGILSEWHFESDWHRYNHSSEWVNSSSYDQMLPLELFHSFRQINSCFDECFINTGMYMNYELEVRHW